jgi:hypothetical protein
MAHIFLIPSCHVVEKFEYRKWGKEEDLGPKKKERGETYGKKEGHTTHTRDEHLLIDVLLTPHI